METLFDPQSFVQGIAGPITFVVGVVLAIVQVSKKLGVKDQAALLTGLGLGCLGGAGYYLAAFGLPGSFADWFKLILVMLITALTPAGVYDLAFKKEKKAE